MGQGSGVPGERFVYLNNPELCKICLECVQNLLSLECSQSFLPLTTGQERTHLGPGNRTNRNFVCVVHRPLHVFASCFLEIQFGQCAGIQKENPL